MDNQNDETKKLVEQADAIVRNHNKKSASPEELEATFSAIQKHLNDHNRHLKPQGELGDWAWAEFACGETPETSFSRKR